VPSRRRLHSEDTPETVVAQYGEDSWSEVGCTKKYKKETKTNANAHLVRYSLRSAKAVQKE